MKRWLLLLALIAAPLHAEVLSVNQFGGLNTDDSPLLLQAQTPDAENVTVDDGPGVQGRKGFVSFSTESVTGQYAQMWEFPLSNGTRYIIEASAGKLKANTGDGTFVVQVSTIPSDRITAGTVLGDKFFFANTTDGIKYWDGSTVGVASATLTVDKLVTFKGRLVGAGKSGTQRVLYFSKYLDGTIWNLAVNPSDDDPAQITVAGSLDENIQALYSSFQDKLMYFKAHSFGAIFGSRRSNFTLRTFSDSVGTGTPESIRDCADKLRWLGPDRKVWEFDGSTYYKITEDIDNLMVTVAQGDSNSRSNTQTSQGDWTAGTQSPSAFLDLTTTPGDQTPARTGLNDTAAIDFQSGSCAPTDSCDYTTTSGSIQPVIFNSTVTSAADWAGGTYDNTVYVDTETSAGNLQTEFPDAFTTFRQGSGTKNVWASVACEGNTTSAITVTGGVLALHINQPTSTAAGANDCYVRTTRPMHDLTAGGTIYFEVPSINLDSTNLSYFLIFSTATSFNGSILFGDNMIYAWKRSGTSFVFNQIQGRKSGALHFSYSPSSTFSLPTTVKVIITSAKWEVWHNGVFTASGTHTMNLHAYYVYWMANPTSNVGTDVGSNIDNFSISPQTFTFTSSAQNTGMTLPWYSNLAATTSGSTTPTYTVQVSADNVSYDAGVAVTNGNAPAVNHKQYEKLNAAFNHTPTSFPDTVTALSDYTVPAYSTYVFTSRTLDTTFVPPVLGLFMPSTTTFGSGGVYVSSTEASSDGSSWDAPVAASSGTKIASASKRYIRYKIVSVPSSHSNYTQLDKVDLTAKSTGTFTSQTIDFGPNISSWGPLNVTDSVVAASSITYQFSAAATSGGVGGTWITVAKGGTPTNTVARFGAVRAVYWMTVATQTPTISDVQVSWNEGSTLRCASAYFSSRYWLSVAISSTSNNRVIVYDKKKNWNRYSGVNADAMVLYNSKLYFANSSGIFNAENGYTDNGTSISSYYRSPTYAPTKLDLYSNFDYLYMTTDSSDSTLATSFQINGIATDYSMGSVQMNATTGLQNFKLPFPATEVQTGKYISIKWTVPGTSFWRINNASLYFQPTVLPE